MYNITNQDRFRIISLACLVILIASLAIFVQLKMYTESGDFSSRELFVFVSTIIMQVFAMFAVILIQTKHSLSMVSNLAYVDELTGLMNRRKFNDTLIAYLVQCRMQQSQIGVLIMDLDRFKAINDSYGHDAGDKIICQFGDRIVEASGKNAIVCRMSGDEFAVMIKNVTTQKDITTICEMVLKAMEEPFVYEGKNIKASVSIGAAIVDGNESPHLSALRMADYALLEAKESGRNKYMIFNDTMATCIKRRRNIEVGLKKAVAERDMNVKYQPFVVQDGSRVSGVEAFVRWNDPVEGEILPAEFIPIAEELGLLEKLGEFILERACCDIKQFGNIRLAVNITNTQFMDDGFISQVERVLKKTGFAANRLELELNQSLLISESEKIKTNLKALRKLGVRIVLDDFGTSYSSLFFLREFKLDRVKLDRQFFTNIRSEKDGVEIIENMIGLGSTFSDRLTVEGVETSEQLKLLSETKAHDLQGFLFSKPLALENLTKTKLMEAISQDKKQNVKPSDLKQIAS